MNDHHDEECKKAFPKCPCYTCKHDLEGDIACCVSIHPRGLCSSKKKCEYFEKEDSDKTAKL